MLTRITSATLRTSSGPVCAKRSPMRQADAVKLRTGTSANGNWIDCKMLSHSLIVLRVPDSRVWVVM